MTLPYVLYSNNIRLPYMVEPFNLALRLQIPRTYSYSSEPASACSLEGGAH